MFGVCVSNRSTRHGLNLEKVIKQTSFMSFIKIYIIYKNGDDMEFIEKHNDLLDTYDFSEQELVISRDAFDAIHKINSRKSSGMVLISQIYSLDIPSVNKTDFLDEKVGLLFRPVEKGLLIGTYYGDSKVEPQIILPPKIVDFEHSINEKYFPMRSLVSFYGVKNYSQERLFSFETQSHTKYYLFNKPDAVVEKKPSFFGKLFELLYSKTN